MRSALSRLPLFGRSLAGATLALLVLAGSASAAIAPEVAHSPNAEDQRTAFWIMLIVAFAIGTPLVLGLIGMARKNASKGGAHEPRRLTAGRGVIGKVGGGLSLVVVIVFIFGIAMSDGVKNADADDGAEELDITAVGQQWLWRFEYPAEVQGSISQGIAGVFSYYNLVVPVDTKVNLTLDSTDVLHSWFVPALGPQVMAVPGKLTETSFIADEEGLYHGRATIFNGTAYPAMRVTVQVVSQDEYDTYVEGLTQDLLDGQAAVQETVTGGPEDSATDTGEDVQD